MKPLKKKIFNDANAASLVHEIIFNQKEVQKKGKNANKCWHIECDSEPVQLKLDLTIFEIIEIKSSIQP